MRYTRLENESDEYVAAREQLRLAEIELLEHRERVAVLRRGLPPGATVDDYEFAEGPTLLEDGDEPQTKVRLSELFTGDTGRSWFSRCTARRRPCRVRCARCGSTDSTAWLSTCGRMPTSSWWRPPTCRRCVAMPAIVGGTGCVF